MNDSEQQRENKKMRAFVRTWRESRDHAFELFDVVLDVGAEGDFAKLARSSFREYFAAAAPPPETGLET